MTVGLTEKSAPLALVPIREPPVPAEYQEMVLSVDVAFSMEDVPKQIVAGVAVTGEGASGTGLKTTMVELEIVPHELLT